MTQLTKETNQEALKNYFAGVIALSRSDDPFPVDLDDVWPLVYTTKNQAVRELKRNRKKGFDYITKEDFILNKSVQNKSEEGEREKTETRGRKDDKYYLTLSTLEEIVVKRIDGVFDVYRKVFRHAVRRTHEYTMSMAPNTIYNLTTRANIEDIMEFIGDMYIKEQSGDNYPIFLPEVFALYFPTMGAAIDELRNRPADYKEGQHYVYKNDGDQTGYYLSFVGFNTLIACRSALCERAYKQAVTCKLIPDMPHLIKIENSPRDIAAAKKLIKARNITGTRKEQASEITDRIMALMGQSEDSEGMRMLSEVLDGMVKYSNFQSNIEEP